MRSMYSGMPLSSNASPNRFSIVTQSSYVFDMTARSISLLGSESPVANDPNYLTFASGHSYFAISTIWSTISFFNVSSSGVSFIKS
jgi:hypothetical protein